MKHRTMRLAALFVLGTAFAIGGLRTTAQAAPLQAGVSAALTECLETETPTKETESTEDICGYRNLGIAQVGDYLNVREDGAEDAKVIGKMKNNAGCEIVDKKGDWYKIESGKVKGYVKADYIVTGDKAREMAEELKTTVAVANGETVYVRQEPNTDCRILKSLEEGQQLKAVEEDDAQDGWVEVELEDEHGYISADYVDLKQVLDTAEKATQPENATVEGSSAGVSAARTAMQYVGGRYVWGGTSLTGGVDCSGFTMRIMAMYGVYLPHSSRAQAGCGKSVSLSELRPGDLVFYGRGGINHVAIYIGGGQIVHAANSRDGIKISNVSYQTPVCCRRVLK